ncbi:ABC transporter substrate-binding protein [Micrococcus terreus]|uniref:NitT/TauT family transport system substrate-binding protein n=1 Tax=Micrococcus terreus TaxID=574650 RepID=A0A1I7MIR5_9MICC|nr:ABC transporter substrate-binding protein [Micrococcus terreus]SFV21797.1 NitT/TauT family transport system substrate-binding protein [Micrococcus terreus]
MNRKFASLLATAAVTSLALAGCGSGSPSGGDTSPAGENSGAASGELEKVTLGVLPIAPSVGAYYGIERGIFEKHGLDVELSTSNAGAAMLPAVANEQITFGVGNPQSVLNANDRGLDMKIIAGYSNSLGEGEDIAGVVATKDSGIAGWDDLAGKTVSVNALKTQGDLTIMEAVEKAGGDPAAVNFSEMPFQDMEAQLERGNTDAVWFPEPFLSRALADDANQLVGYNFQEAIPGMPTMVTFTSGTYASENPEVTQKFVDAMTESLAAVEENPEEARAMLTEFINLPEDAAQNLRMEELSGEIRKEQIEQSGQLMVKFGFIGKGPDVEKLYWEGQ